MNGADPITSDILTNIDRAKEFLDSFTGTFEEVREAEGIVKRADAWVEFFKHCDMGLEAQNTVAELKIRFQRKLGALLGEAQPVGRPRKGNCAHHAQFPDGLDRYKAIRYRKIASIPTVEFEDYLLTTKHEGLELTTAGVLRRWKSLNRPPKEDETIPAEIPPDEPEDDDEPIQAEFWKSATTCRDEVRRVARKLKDIRLVLSGLVESPYKPLLKKAAHSDLAVKLEWDGERAGASHGSVTLVEKLYTCPALESLTRMVGGLERLFDREVTK